MIVHSKFSILDLLNKNSAKFGVFANTIDEMIVRYFAIMV